ncbi:Probable protein ABIL5 [Linum grandiflorum]
MDSRDHHQFIKSLQELKELHSQLRRAADYWEKGFQNAKEKKKVVESTKEYVCRAVVAVVDHLGSVSVSLNTTICDKTSGFSGAELRIDSLKQRLLSYELYTQKIGLTRTRWCSNLAKLHRRYMTTQIERDASPAAPWKICDDNKASSSANSTDYSIVPVGDTITVCGKGQPATFHFQQSSYGQKKKKDGHRRWYGGRSSGDVMSLVRRSKRLS